MEGIETQFWGKVSPSVDVFAMAKKLVSKKVKPPSDCVILDFWNIGPRDKDEKALYLTGSIARNTRTTFPTAGTIVFPILSIVGGEHPKDIYVMVDGFPEWYYCDANISAFSYAKRMDLFLHGCYSDVWPVSHDFVTDAIEGASKKKKGV